MPAPTTGSPTITSPDIAATPESSFVPTPSGEPLGHLPEPVCAPATTADDLTAIFAAGHPVIGADYQRAYPLPDGRLLWLLQDAFLPTAAGAVLVHNVGLLQSGDCFQLLTGNGPAGPEPYLFGDQTEPLRHWFWPLGGDMGADGLLHVFVVEFRERRDGYLSHAVPTATWLAGIDTTTLEVVERRPAPDSSDRLYGWSVVSHGEFTYLYAHCYRQFGWQALPFGDSEVLAHDWSCTAQVTVARVPRGHFDTPAEYWNGAGWTSDGTQAVAVIPTTGRAVNPTQVALLDGRFVAVTKEGDWWGTTIYLDTAPAAEGPWTTYATVGVPPGCAGCNTYFASVVPYGATDGTFVVGLSRNAWNGLDLSDYAPVFFRVPAPLHTTSGPAL